MTQPVVRIFDFPQTNCFKRTHGVLDVVDAIAPALFSPTLWRYLA